MLKLRWPLRKKAGETEPHAQEGDAAAGVREATPPDDATTTPDEATRAQEELRVRESLEAIKTAVVWLVVINILTVLSPLLWLPLKWALAVGVLLTAGSIVIGVVAYLRARRMQRGLPE